MRASRKPRRAWLFALMMALVGGLGAIATHLVAEELHPRLAAYRWAPWVVFGVFLASAFLGVIRNSRRTISSDKDLGGDTNRGSITIGGDAKGINVAGDGNTILHRDNKG